MTLTHSLEVQEMWCLNEKRVLGAVGHGDKDTGTVLEFCFHHNLGRIWHKILNTSGLSSLTFKMEQIIPISNGFLSAVFPKLTDG